MFTNKLTFNGDLWVLGSRWSWSRLVHVGTDLLLLFGSLQFLLVVRLLLSMQLLLDLERSAASIRRHCFKQKTLCEQKAQLNIYNKIVRFATYTSLLLDLSEWVVLSPAVC